MSAFVDGLRALVDVEPARVAAAYRLIEGKPRASAVLVVVAGERPEGRLLLVRRAKTLTHHAGEIAFPGGVPEPSDVDLVATALRETREETGLEVERGGVLGRIDEVIAGQRYVISPFVAWVPSLPALTIDPGEIDAVLTPRLSQFLNRDRVAEEVLQRRGTRIRMPVFHLDEGRVWGATARIIQGFLTRASRAGVTIADG